MKTKQEMHRQIGLKLISQRPENIVSLSIQMWGLMASELIPIIGESGFMSLYFSSFKLTQLSFPKLLNNQLRRRPDSQFASLKLSLEGLSDAEACEASKALLITFIDILSDFIGAPLTNRICEGFCDNSKAIFVE